MYCWIISGLVLLGSTLGVSQNFTLTKNSGGLECPGSITEYNCTASTSIFSVIRWTVNTSIPVRDVSYIAGIAMPGASEQIAPNIQVQLLQVQPFIITTLIIVSDSTFEEADILCIADQEILKDSFNTGSEISPVREVSVEPVVADFVTGNIKVTFQPPDNSIGIDFYRVTCNEDSCGFKSMEIRAPQTEVNLIVSSSISGLRHNIGVQAVNICGRQSTAVFGSGTIKANGGYIATLLLTVIGGFFSLLVIIVLLVLVILFSCKMKRLKEELENCHNEKDKNIAQIPLSTIK